MAHSLPPRTFLSPFLCVVHQAHFFFLRSTYTYIVVVVLSLFSPSLHLHLRRQRILLYLFNSRYIIVHVSNWLQFSGCQPMPMCCVPSSYLHIYPIPAGAGEQSKWIFDWIFPHMSQWRNAAEHTHTQFRILFETWKMFPTHTVGSVSFSGDKRKNCVHLQVSTMFFRNDTIRFFLLLVVFVLGMMTTHASIEIVRLQSDSINL